MKNLQLSTLKRKALNIFDQDARHIAFVNDRVYVLRNNVLTVYEDGPGEVFATTSCSSSDVIQFEFLTQEQLLWIGAKSEFICVNLFDKSIKKIVPESEPSFEFASAEWNPSKDAFVAIKLNGDLYAFEVNYEQQLLKVIKSCSLQDQLSHLEQLGWGSAERQFRSPEEIALMRSLQNEEAKSDPDQSIKISWRGNSEQFAVNYYENGIRKIRVYDYPCNLLYQSEDVVGLQSVIAWKPFGCWISGVIWTTKRCQLALFEKNCLIKSTFDLAKTAYVNQLKWSPSGEILAVHQSADEENYTSIDLYWFNNHIMYLKQRLQFLEVNPLIGFDFLKSNDSVLVLRATTLYEAITYSFKFVYYCSQTVNRNHTSCVAINGRKALLTRCIGGMKPPPAYDFVAEVYHPINFVTFHPLKPLVALIDSYNEVTVFRITETCLQRERSYKLRGEPGFIAPLKFHQFSWVLGRIFCVGEQTAPQSKEVDGYYLLLDDESASWTFTMTTYFDKGLNVSGLVEQKDNLFQSIGTDDAIGIGKDLIPLSSRAVTHLYMRSILINDEMYVFSLTATNKFFVNDNEVLQGVLSFIVYDKYLFVTVVDGKLYGVRINKRTVAELIKKNFTNVYSRQVELGASLICLIPDTSYVAMQIPRGNIELCSCRIITIDRIEKLLVKQEWGAALDIVRIEKLNTNVLVDLNLSRFLADIRIFIRAVAIPANLSEFLLALEDTSIFNDAYSNCAIDNLKEIKGKRNLVCNAMVKNMEALNHRYYINAIITACFVKDSPTAISEALHYVQGLLNNVNEDPSAITPAVEAFKSAHTLKSNKDMFEKALLTYDLDLILFVARNIEMDPLEYEPLIEELKNLDMCRRRFRINDSLGNYFEAFQYLVRSATDNDEEVLDYIKEHNIYLQVIWYIKPETTLYIELSRVIGINLQGEGKHEEAGIFFYRAKLYNEALNAYKTGLCWQQAMDLMDDEMNLNKTETIAIFRYMAEELKNVGRVKEASHIYEKHLDDYETAIKICIEDKLFSRAVKLAKKYKRKDIYESDIVEGICLYCSTLTDKFNRMLENFKVNKLRLLALRVEKKERFEQEEDFQFMGTTDIADDVGSIISTSTVHSMASTSSRSSSRSRRKQERKKHSTREGSIYEDIALMEMLYNLIHEAFEWGSKARELCLIVLRFKKPQTVPSLTISMCNSLIELQKEMKASIQEIWPPNMNNIDAEPSEVAIYKNINILDMKFRTPPSNLMISWKVDAFPTVSLGF